MCAVGRDEKGLGVELCDQAEAEQRIDAELRIWRAGDAKEDATRNGGDFLWGYKSEWEGGDFAGHAS